MTYEKAKQLKDAGFPKDVLEYTVCKECKHPCPPIKNHGYPTLSELIEACGEKMWGLMKALYHEKGEVVNGWACNGMTTFGSTPEEAVANLWLQLNTDKKS